MKIRQISVVLENSAGKLHEIAELLCKGDIDIRSIWVSEQCGFSAVHMIVDKPEAASALLERAGYPLKVDEVFALKADDGPGGLMKILEVLKSHDLNIEYVYGFGEKSDNKAVFIFRITDIERAIEVMKAGVLERASPPSATGGDISAWEFVESL